MAATDLIAKGRRFQLEHGLHPAVHFVLQGVDVKQA